MVNHLLVSLCIWWQNSLILKNVVQESKATTLCNLAKRRFVWIPEQANQATKAMLCILVISRLYYHNRILITTT